VEGHAVISHEVLAAYARDAAREVDGVADLVPRPRRSGGVQIVEEDGKTTVELHVSLDWGVDAAAVGVEVQRRVAEYLARTARLPSVTVDVVVDGIAAGD
jgi:uncharacterized alkaline shock family protein YloU